MIAAGLVMLIAIAGAVVAVGTQKIVHAIFGLAVSLGGIALAFLLLGAPFIAAMEVLIYIGGITIAMIFAVMLTPTGKDEPRTRRGRRIALAAAASVLLFVALASVIVGADFADAAAVPDRTPEELAEAWSVKAIGRALLDDFNVAFELLSAVLLVAIVGAISIAIRADDGLDPAIDPGIERALDEENAA